MSRKIVPSAKASIAFQSKCVAISCRYIKKEEIYGRRSRSDSRQSEENYSRRNQNDCTNAGFANVVDLSKLDSDLQFNQDIVDIKRKGLKEKYRYFIYPLEIVPQEVIFKFM